MDLHGYICNQELIGAKRSVIPLSIARGKSLAIATVAFLMMLTAGQTAFAVPGHIIPLLTPASNTAQLGFVRIINHSDRDGRVGIYAIDDSGERFGPVFLSLKAKTVVHFNSKDLEQGNTSKGLSGGIGDGEGNWWLELDADVDIEPLIYIRTASGFLTNIQDVVARESGPGRYRVPTFNPGSNRHQRSLLRLINPNDSDTEITVAGLDDNGMPSPRGAVRLKLPAGGARMISAQQLESGDKALSGRLGDGNGKWQLFVSADRPLKVMSLVSSPDGNLSNLSQTLYETVDTIRCDKTVTVVKGGDPQTNYSEVSLGDLTKVEVVRARQTGTVQGSVYEDEDLGSEVPNARDIYMFTLTDTSLLRVELRNLTGDANLFLFDASTSGGNRGYYGYRTYNVSGGRITASENGGILDESIVKTLDAGTYFIDVVSPREQGPIQYELRYANDSAIPGRTFESAFDLNDLTDVGSVRTHWGRFAARNETCLFGYSYYRFVLTDTRQMRVELRNLTGNADLYLYNAAGGDPIARSREGGTLDESIVKTLDAGTYFILVWGETSSTSTRRYQLRYANDSAIPGRTFESAFDLGDLTGVRTLRTRAGHLNTSRNEARLFGYSYYRFVLTDTRQMRVELRNLTGNADLYLYNAAGGDPIARSREGGTLDESIVKTLDAGTYFVLVWGETSSTSTFRYRLYYGAES